MENLAKLGADDADVAAVLGISVAALNKRFGRAIVRARAERRTHIRKLVWTAVTDGNVPLLVWLGKAELGWTQPPSRESHLESKPRRKEFDNDAFELEFARTHGAGAVSSGDGDGDGKSSV